MTHHLTRLARVLTLLALLLAVIAPASARALTNPDTSRPPTFTVAAPHYSTAAVAQRWGQPSVAETFTTGTSPASWWSVYNGPGHHNQGRRSPAAWKVHDGIVSVYGDSRGTTGGMSADWPGSDAATGRWEVRMRTNVRDPRYHPVLILWPQDGYKRGKCDGEVDFSESTKDTSLTHFYLHHGCDNRQESVAIRNDTTQWHTYAVERTATTITGYIDGRQWFRDAVPAHQPPRPMHLTIQLDYFPNDGTGPLKASRMDVDWARQYPGR